MAAIAVLVGLGWAWVVFVCGLVVGGGRGLLLCGVGVREGLM